MLRRSPPIFDLKGSRVGSVQFMRWQVLWRRHSMDGVMVLWANSSRVIGRHCSSMPTGLDLRLTRPQSGLPVFPSTEWWFFFQCGGGQLASEGWL